MNPQQPNDSDLTKSLDNLFEEDESWRSYDARLFDPAALIPKITTLIQDEILKARLDELDSLITRLPVDEFGDQKYVLNIKARGGILDRTSELSSQLNQPNTNKETTNGDYVKGAK